MIEKNKHSAACRLRCIETTRGKVQNTSNLLWCEMKPLGHLANCSSGFQIFKDCSYRHPGIFEDPCPGNSSWNTFHGWAL